MQKIVLISVGRLKEDFFKKAEQEYLKRLNGYCEINVIEIPQTVLPQNPSDAQVMSALEQEAELIINKIPKNSQVVTLCIEGKLLSSEQMAEMIEDNANVGSGVITFIIGGSFGLSERVKSKSKIRISMSKMTFPHRMARIMLLEQIYRGYTIISGSRYHK